MHIDIIIGNPPYQEQDGGGGIVKSSQPLYNKFILELVKLYPRYISMIIPSRWLNGGKSSLEEFRYKMISSNHIRKIVTYDKCWDVFDNVDIAGGILYFLYDNENTYTECEVTNIIDGNKQVLKRRLRDYNYIDTNGDVQYIVISDNRAISIIEKVRLNRNSFLYDIVNPRNTFGLSSFFSDADIQDNIKQVKVICSNGRVTYTNIDNITDTGNIIHRYKVICAKINPDRGGNNNSDSYNVISKPMILGPNEVCTETYLVLNTFETKQEADNFIHYISTKLARFLIYTTLSGINITRKNYLFIPIEDYSEKWDDLKTNNLYELDKSDISYIDHKIKQWI